MPVKARWKHRATRRVRTAPRKADAVMQAAFGRRLHLPEGADPELLRLFEAPSDAGRDASASLGFAAGAAAAGRPCRPLGADGDAPGEVGES